MKEARLNKKFYIVTVAFIMAISAISFPFLYSGPSQRMLLNLTKAETFAIVVFGSFGLILYFITKLEITDKKELIITQIPKIWENKILITAILKIYRTPRLKPFDTMYESLSVAYKNNNDQIKNNEIDLNRFKPEDIAEILKELIAVNPTIRFDDYCESLINGEYFKKEQEQLQKRREKIKREFNLRRLSRVAGTTVLLGIGLIILLVLYILYFSGSN